MLSKPEEKKQDPRVKRTRQLLQQALMRLMSEKSFQSITVQDIAERATVNRVTFYAHFADKQALLEYSIREAFRQHLRTRLPEDAPYSPDNLHLLVQLVCEFLAEMSGHCPPPRSQFEPLMEKQVKAAIYEVVQPWVAEMRENGSKSRPGPDQAAVAASWAIYGMAVQWSEKARREPAAEFAHGASSLILAFLQSPARQPRRA